MIVVWGFKTYKSKEVKTTEISCEVCHKSSISIQFYQEYYHLFWIPVIPTKRYASVTCTNCGHSIDNKTLSPNYQNVYKKLRPMPPVWMFIGILLCMLITGLNYWQKTKKDDSILQASSACQSSPITVGKIYQVGVDRTYKIDASSSKHPNSKLIEITSVTADSVFFLIGRHGREAEYDLMPFATASNEFIDPYTLSLSEFKNMEFLNCK